MQLSTGRIELNEDEKAAVEKLAHENDGAAISLTRRDPGETGPLLVHVDDATYEVGEDGKRKKVA